MTQFVAPPREVELTRRGLDVWLTTTTGEDFLVFDVVDERRVKLGYPGSEPQATERWFFRWIDHRVLDEIRRYRFAEGETRRLGPNRLAVQLEKARHRLTE